MRTHSLRAAALLLVMGTAHGGGISLLDNWGTEAIVSVADCPSFCTNFNFGPVGGGIGSSTAATSFDEFRGSARAEAALTGTTSTPVLRAESFANPSSRGGFASAFAVQGYTYSGAGTTLTLDATLTGDLVDPTSASFAEISAVVAIFQINPFEFFSDEGTLVFELGAQYLQTTGGGDARMQFELLNTGSINQTQSLSVDLADGDQFYIWALLDANAISGSTAGSAEAFNSLTMAFDDDTGLSPAAVVPIPAAVWLFGSALLGLAGIARKKAA